MRPTTISSVWSYLSSHPMTGALFTRDGDSYQPSGLTQGPWSPDAQHGGPPAALLAGAIERTPSDEEMVVVRVLVDLLRPVPLERLDLSTKLLRPGRRVQSIGVTLTHGHQEVARAQGLRIRRADLDLPYEQSSKEISIPEEARAPELWEDSGAFAKEAMEIRMVDGDFSQPGPGSAWFRLRVPVIEGQPTTGTERVAAAADFGNGVSNLAGAQRKWLFINPDLEIRLARPPVGEWVLLDSESRLHDTGTGLATSVISDESGLLGTAAQSLYVAPMDTA